MKNKFLNNLVIAHRGIHNNKDIPENSLLSFIISRNKNIPIELDIRCTKDNEIVVFHDYNLFRMTGINKRINKCSLKEIKNYKLKETNYLIPSLQEILNLIDGKVLIDIEIKNIPKKKLKYLEKILKDYNGEIIITSFNSANVNYFKKKNYTVGLILGINFFKRTCSLISCKPDFLAVSKRFVKTKKVQNKRKKDISIFVWTINKKEISYYKKYSDSFICDIFGD